MASTALERAGATVTTVDVGDGRGPHRHRDRPARGHGSGGARADGSAVPAVPARSGRHRGEGPVDPAQLPALRTLTLAQALGDAGADVPPCGC